VHVKSNDRSLCKKSVLYKRQEFGTLQNVNFAPSVPKSEWLNLMKLKLRGFIFNPKKRKEIYILLKENLIRK